MRLAVVYPSAFLGAVLAVCWVISGRLHVAIYCAGAVASAILGAIAYLTVRIKLSPRTAAKTSLPSLIVAMQQETCERIFQATEHKDKVDKAAVVISRSIDQALSDVIDVICREHVMRWLKDMATAPESIRAGVKRDLEVAAHALAERLSRVDHVSLLATDVLRKITEHFERVRIALDTPSTPINSRQHVPEFRVSPHLASPERELEYLSRLAEMLIIYLMPSSYGNCLPLRHFLRELLARQVLFPAVAAVTDPDVVNARLLEWLNHRGGRANSAGTVVDIGKEACLHADSFEEFLGVINAAKDANELMHIRHSIINEIMQATTLEALRDAKGTMEAVSGSMDDEAAEKVTARKRNLLSPRHLKRYVSQLALARTACERRLRELGSRCDHHEADSAAGAHATSIHGYSFDDVMGSSVGRRFFRLHLQDEDRQELLDFWAAVQDLRKADRTNWHKVATDIFYKYINKSTSGMMSVDKPALKRIEAFLLGNSGGPDVFFDLQKNIAGVLKEKHFDNFVMSGRYREMLDETKRERLSVSEDNEDDVMEEMFAGINPNDSKGERRILGQSDITKEQLKHITERLQNKSQALEALQTSFKSDSKILSRLQSEVDTLQKHASDIRQHLDRTESWSDHLGRWRCHVQSVEHGSEAHEGAGGALHANLLVYVPKANGDEGGDVSGGVAARDIDKHSWTCVKKLSEFHGLHKELVPLKQWIKQLDLPPASKSIFARTASSKAVLEKARSVTQKYVDAILADEHLSQSEPVYSFLSPSPACLKGSGTAAVSPPHHATKAFGPFSGVFGGDSANKEEDDELWLDEFDATTVREGSAGNSVDQARDADATDIAESLYALIGEIFDMRGVFKWIRKSLMTFAQITYGSSINRQIRDTVAWVTSEQMILHYLQALKALVVSGSGSGGGTHEELNSSDLRTETRTALLQNMPEELMSLVGQQAAANGAAKVFEVLQSVTLNKQLLYNVLELVVCEIFPELSVSPHAHLHHQAHPQTSQ